MTFLLLKFLVWVGLLGAIIVGIIRTSIISGWIFKPSEIAALRSVAKDVIPTMKKGDVARNNQINLFALVL